MQFPDNFTFISPIPYPIPNQIEMENAIWLEPFTAKECVEFFWRVQKIILTINAHLYIYDNVNDEVITDETRNVSIDSSTVLGAFSKTPIDRIEEDFLIYGDGDSTSLYLMGPYRHDSGGDNVDFTNRLFSYNLQFTSSVGTVMLENAYIPENDVTVRTTIKTIPFDFLGKTYYIYMNAPNGFLEEYSQGYTITYDATVNFDIQYYDNEDDTQTND